MDRKEAIKRVEQAIEAFNKEITPGKEAYLASEGPTLQAAFYKALKSVLEFEELHPQITSVSRKQVLVHLQDIPPGHCSSDNHEYFDFIYSRFSPVRFAVETMDSLDEYQEFKGE